MSTRIFVYCLLLVTLPGCGLQKLVPADPEPLTANSLVLVADACVRYAQLTPLGQADVSAADRTLRMSPEARRAAGVVENPTLSPAELRDYAAVQSSPCRQAAGDWVCVSHAGSDGHHWAMCTNGTIVCGVGTKGPFQPTTAWCR